MDISQSRVHAGSACLLLAKVPPDRAAHIPPLLGGHAVTATRGAAVSGTVSFPSGAHAENLGARPCAFSGCVVAAKVPRHRAAFIVGMLSATWSPDNFIDNFSGGQVADKHSTLFCAPQPFPWQLFQTCSHTVRRRDGSSCVAAYCVASHYDVHICISTRRHAMTTLRAAAVFVKLASGMLREACSPPAPLRSPEKCATYIKRSVVFCVASCAALLQHADVCRRMPTYAAVASASHLLRPCSVIPAFLTMKIEWGAGGGGTLVA